MHPKKCGLGWWGQKKEMTIINCGALCCNFGMCGLNYKVTQNFRVSLDEKAKSNLKLIKVKVLEVLDLLLFPFVFFSYRQSRARFRVGHGRRAAPFLFLQSLVFFLNYFEELQTVSFEVEFIFNNKP